MESKTRANKRLKLEISRSDQPGHEIKLDIKRWETSWKKKIDIREKKLFTQKTLVKAMSDPVDI